MRKYIHDVFRDFIKPKLFKFPFTANIVNGDSIFPLGVCAIQLDSF